MDVSCWGGLHSDHHTWGPPPVEGGQNSQGGEWSCWLGASPQSGQVRRKAAARGRRGSGARQVKSGWRSRALAQARGAACPSPACSGPSSQHALPTPPASSSLGSGLMPRLALAPKLSTRTPVSLQNYELTLHEGTYKAVQRGPGGGLPYRVRYMGTHLAIEARSGLVVSWDRKTSVLIRLQQDYKVRAGGLLGPSGRSRACFRSSPSGSGGPLRAGVGHACVGAVRGTLAPNPPTVCPALLEAALLPGPCSASAPLGRGATGSGACLPSCPPWTHCAPGLPASSQGAAWGNQGPAVTPPRPGCPLRPQPHGPVCLRAPGQGLRAVRELRRQRRQRLHHAEPVRGGRRAGVRQQLEVLPVLPRRPGPQGPLHRQPLPQVLGAEAVQHHQRPHLRRLPRPRTCGLPPGSGGGSVTLLGSGRPLGPAYGR